MISELIRWEGSALLTSLFWGMVFAGIYDCIRILRRIVRHRKVWIMTIEDIVYWIYVGIRIFVITYEMNNGIVRGFSVAGFILGATLYRFVFGRFFVKYVSKAILFVLKPLKKLARFIRIKIKQAVTVGKKRRAVRREQNCKKAEADRIEKEKKAEADRIEKEKKAEAERLEKERKAEAERLEKERKAEAERLEKERKAEAERLEKEKKAETERLEKERKAEARRSKKAHKAAEKASKNNKDHSGT